MSKFIEFLMESTSASFFLSPRGELVPCDIKHITSIIKNPLKFGLSEKYIKSVYEKYNEKIGAEGKAREEILIYLIKRGWIRMRRYRNRYWSVTVSRISPKLINLLRDWAKKILKGTPVFKETDKFFPVKINPVVGGAVKNTTVKKLSETGLYEHSDYPDEIVVLESIKDLPDMELYPICNEKKNEVQ